MTGEASRTPTPTPVEDAMSAPTTTSHLTTITMPQLGESVVEGTLGNWLKQVGDTIAKYESLV